MIPLIRNIVFYKEVAASSVSDAANLFVDFFSSNFVSDEDIQEKHLAGNRHNFSRKLYSTSVHFFFQMMKENSNQDL